jgi:SAM-dependent methyltransferase
MEPRMGTDRDWENWGQKDPYYGVLSDDDFRASTLNAERKKAFFQSGEQHVDALLETIRSFFSADFRPRRALDFGCGVGRLLIPLAKRSDQAVGVDVSPSMLTEAASNCADQQVHNVELVVSDDALSQVHGQYDLIHSHIVFAHIHPQRGNGLIRVLASKVSAGGFIAVQILYSCNAPRWRRALVKLRYTLPPLNAIRNLMRGRSMTEPAMQLHVYDLRTQMKTLRKLGFGRVMMILDVFDNDEFDSVVLVAQRGPTAK